MRAWLYDHLTSDLALQSVLGGVDGIKDRVNPRHSENTINIPKPFLMIGLGNATNEDLVDDSDPADAFAERQFFQVWIHDEGGSFLQIDETLIPIVLARLKGAQSPAHRVTLVRYLETSAEFSNDTYNTIFRYIRFQAIRSQGGTPQ